MTNKTAPAPLAPARPRRSLGEWLTRNPVTLKELRGRMRGARAFITLVIYLGLMSAFVSLLYALYVSSGSNYYSGYNAGPDRQLLGKFVFGAVVGIELLLVCFICPAFTVGAISGERERQTFDLLRTTLLRARALVLGKLVSSLSYAALLLVAALPLQSLAFLLGGVAAEEVAIASVLLLSTAFLYSAAGDLFFILHAPDAGRNDFDLRLCFARHLWPAHRALARHSRQFRARQRPFSGHTAAAGAGRAALWRRPVHCHQPPGHRHCR